VTDIRKDRMALFGNLQSADTQPQFGPAWPMTLIGQYEGTYPLVGRYHSKE
jgi:hypothetical protein